MCADIPAKKELCTANPAKTEVLVSLCEELMYDIRTVICEVRDMRPEQHECEVRYHHPSSNWFPWPTPYALRGTSLRRMRIGLGAVLQINPPKCEVLVTEVLVYVCEV